MSQATPQPQTANVYVPQNPRNGLGLAGFITSIVGWITFGLLCPIGLLLSIIALFKAPRGFAIAGLVIGVLGSAFLWVFGLTIIEISGVGTEIARESSVMSASIEIKADAELNNGVVPDDVAEGDPRYTNSSLNP